MRLILIVLFIFSSVVMADMEVSMGVGAEARVGSDVNPENQSALGLGQLYASMAFHPWSFLWEIDLQTAQQTSGIGNYTVSSQTYGSTLWGRYEPWSYLHWSPYVGAGLGQQFVQVKTQFGSAVDERWTDGGLQTGLATGIMTSLWKHWNLEGEFQVLKSEFANNAGFGFVLRTGYTF